MVARADSVFKIDDDGVTRDGSHPLTCPPRMIDGNQETLVHMGAMTDQ